MNLTTLFDRITSKQKQRHHSRVADYRSLVAQIADGKEPDPAQIDELLAANGKTVDDLKADVDLHIKRLAWRKEYDALPGLAKERKVLEKQIAEADKVLEAADAHHTDVTTPLYYRLGAIKEATRLGNHACDELRRTCNDQDVSGHSKPATVGGMKSSHFERGEIRCRGTSTFLVLTESTYGESAQDGEYSFDSIAACVALVPAADCPRAGDRSVDGPEVPLVRVGRGKTRHFARRPRRGKTSHVFGVSGSTGDGDRSSRFC